MMRILDLLLADPAHRSHASMPEMDPLTEEGALQEAQLLDLRFDALADVVGIIFELRQALQLREANTGVLVARGVRKVTWAGQARGTALSAWPIGGSVPRVQDGVFELSLGLWGRRGACLELTAETAAFFVGDVPGLSEAPTDYTDHDRASIVGKIACWESLFEPIGAVFLDAAPAV
jgi:hypothetical protein